MAEYAPVFLKWLSFVRKRSENTVRGYGEDLKSFLGFCETAGLSKPDDVSFRHLEFYVGWLQQQRGLKPAGANRHIQALRTFWKWMVRTTPAGEAGGVLEVRTAQIGALPGVGARCPGFCGSTDPRIVMRCSEGSPHRLAWAATRAAASTMVSATVTQPQEQDTAHRAAIAELT